MDVYDHAISHGRSRHAFDISDTHDEERVVIGGRGGKSSSITLPTSSVSLCQLLEGWIECSRILDTSKWPCRVPRWQTCTPWVYTCGKTDSRRHVVSRLRSQSLLQYRQIPAGSLYPKYQKGGNPIPRFFGNGRERRLAGRKTYPISLRQGSPKLTLNGKSGYLQIRFVSLERRDVHPI